jgi:hypothetical protein
MAAALTSADDQCALAALGLVALIGATRAALANPFERRFAKSRSVRNRCAGLLSTAAAAAAVKCRRRG